MKIYLVGGSVRDALIGRNSEDRDWVVVGSETSEMLALGYKQVGADFPVFLHPESGDEYALARVERKTAAGYGGFTASTKGVTLEEDLLRRDLTINAMALDDAGQLVDPYGGRQDLEARLLRHVSEAFEEGPLRVLRLLRFHARFGPTWSVAKETWDLALRLVDAGELSALVSERIWKEVSRALMEPHPEIFLQGMLSLQLEKLDAFFPYRGLDVGVLPSVAAAARNGASLEARFALAFASTVPPQGHPTIPTSIQRLSLVWQSSLATLQAVQAPQAYAKAINELLVRLGAYKVQQGLTQYLEALHATGVETSAFEQAAARALAVDTKAITAALPAGPAVGLAITAARIAAIEDRT